MNEEQQYCFFGTAYHKKCLCGWTKEMERQVPQCYGHEDDKIKYYVRFNNRKSTLYGAQRRKQNKTESPPKDSGPTFTVYFSTNRVKTKGEWPKKMEKYLQSALVKSKRGFLTCIGHVDSQGVEGMSRVCKG